MALLTAYPCLAQCLEKSRHSADLLKTFPSKSSPVPACYIHVAVVTIFLLGTEAELALLREGNRKRKDRPHQSK